MYFVVFDGPRRPAEGDVFLAWRGYGEGPQVTSIPRYLERHGEELRAKYLAFVHDLGETVVAGRRIREHFDTGDGFSLWWMNRIPEKSPFKCLRIVDCLRLLALEEILVSRSAEGVTLHTADDALRDSVAELCRGLRISFAHAARPALRRAWSIRRLYESLPYTVQGLLSFRHLILRWPFRRLRPIEWFRGPRAIFACSYLYNLDSAAVERGEFHSHQWEGLPGLLHEQGGRVNWVHHFLPDGARDVRTSLLLLDTFNRDAERQGHHAFLETYLSSHAVWRIGRRWFALRVAGWRLRRVSAAFRLQGSAAWLWPLLKDDWNNSIRGTAAVSSCTWYVLFDAALREEPHQARGVYLYEGQGWESALVHAWRKNGHGEIVAVPHSTMPFWYLNIYDDPRCLAAGGCRKPLPDRWALNGKMAWRALTSAGYPAERLVPVEALRYTYLETFASRARADAETGGENRAASARSSVRLLVLGDFTREQTLRMLNCVEAAVPSLGVRPSITVKLHPACRVERREVPGLDCEFTDHALGEILDDFDVAFCSNTTSAGLDALLAGLPVIAFLDDEGLNQSPLRGADVTFVSTAEELAQAVLVSAGRRPDTPPEEFFWLDGSLPRWRNLLLPATERRV